MNRSLCRNEPINKRDKVAFALTLLFSATFATNGTCIVAIGGNLSPIFMAIIVNELRRIKNNHFLFYKGCFNYTMHIQNVRCQTLLCEVKYFFAVERDWNITLI